MKYLPTIFFVTFILALTAVSAFAQTTVYLGSDYKPASATNYTYKRVIKYQKPILNPNLGIGYYGNITSNVQLTGLHVCSLTDYYKTGEPALVMSIVTQNYDCSKWIPQDGEAIYYHKNGNLKRKESYKSGKLNGTVVHYNEDGTENRTEDYANGKLLERGKFAAPSNSPMLGMWKYEEFQEGSTVRYVNGQFTPVKTYTPTRKSTYNYLQNGIVESTHEIRYRATDVAKGYWKYTPKNATSGVLEEFQGEDLIERGNVKWLGRDKLEFTITFSTNSQLIGKQFTWVRESAPSK